MTKKQAAAKQSCWRRMSESEGFIVATFERIFFYGQAILSPLYHLEYLLTLYLDQRVNGKVEHKHPDYEFRYITSITYRDKATLWRLLISGVLAPALLLVYPIPTSWVFTKHFCVVIGCLGICEILQHHLNVILFQRVRRLYYETPSYMTTFAHPKGVIRRCLSFSQVITNKDNEVVTSAPRRLFLILIDYWLLIVFSAIASWPLHKGSFDRNFTSFGDALYFQVITATTIGYGDIKPITGGAKCLVAFQSLSAILFTLIAIAYTITLLPRMTVLTDTSLPPSNTTHPIKPNQGTGVEP